MPISSVTSGSSTASFQVTDDVTTSAVDTSPAVDTSAAAQAASATSSYQGPSGTVTQGDAAYVVANGQVSLNGATIGTVNDQGDYQVTVGGQTVSGNVGQLVGATVEATLSNCDEVDTRPTGRVMVGGNDFDVKNGEVFSAGQRIGTVNDAGGFDVTIDGQRQQGNVADVPGAIYLGQSAHGERYDNEFTGSVRVDGQTYQVTAGQVTQGGKPLGTVDDQGRFALTIDGQARTGSLADVAGAEVTIGHRPYVAGDFDPFGNRIEWHTDPQTHERDGYHVLEYAPGNQLSNGATVVEQSTNALEPDKNYRLYSDGTRVWWDGKVPSILETPPSAPADTLGFEGIRQRADSLDPKSPTLSQDINAIDNDLTMQWAENGRQIDRRLASGEITKEQATELARQNTEALQVANLNVRTLESKGLSLQIFDPSEASPQDLAKLARFQDAAGQYGFKPNLEDPNGARFALRAITSGIGDSPDFAAALSRQSTTIDAAFMKQYQRLPTEQEKMITMIFMPEKDLFSKLWAERADDLASGKYFSNLGLQKLMRREAAAATEG